MQVLVGKSKEAVYVTACACPGSTDNERNNTSLDNYKIMAGTTSTSVILFVKPFHNEKYFDPREIIENDNIVLFKKFRSILAY